MRWTLKTKALLVTLKAKTLKGTSPHFVLQSSVTNAKFMDMMLSYVQAQSKFKVKKPSVINSETLPLLLPTPTIVVCFDRHPLPLLLPIPSPIRVTIDKLFIQSQSLTLKNSFTRWKI